MTEMMKLIDDNGIRLDGRKYNVIQPLRIMAGVTTRADGSAYVEWGGNKVLAAVYGPHEIHPKHLVHPTRAIVRCRYKIAAFAVFRGRPRVSESCQDEISITMRDAFEQVILTERFPRSAIDVVVEVLEARSGTVCAALTAASVALANAGIPMRDLLPACSVGKGSDRIVLDPSDDEKIFCDTVIEAALMPRSGDVVHLRLDGKLAVDEFHGVMRLVNAACMTVYELQKAALKESLVSGLSLHSMTSDECGAMEADVGRTTASEDMIEDTEIFVDANTNNDVNEGDAGDTSLRDIPDDEEGEVDRNSEGSTGEEQGGE